MQQCLPLAVLKRYRGLCIYIRYTMLQQCLPLAVLKRMELPLPKKQLLLKLQQCLPLAVLKHFIADWLQLRRFGTVATVLTACGIETGGRALRLLAQELLMLQQCLPLAVLKPTCLDHPSNALIYVATVLTACGIETLNKFQHLQMMHLLVATVLTACGIETNVW